MSSIARRLSRLNVHLESSLYTLSIYALPVALLVVSLVALFSWQHFYGEEQGGQPLAFSALEAGTPLEPAQALARLADHPPVRSQQTRLSEQPFWLLVRLVQQHVDPATRSVEFTSRHAMDMDCWDAGTLRWLGHADRTGTQGELSPLKAGFVMNLAHAGQPAALLCRASFFGPARIGMTSWTAADLDASAQAFHRNAGLLDGGLIVLALFVLTTALINRSGLYVLFAVWLVINLRMGALSAGWDTQWLGRTVPTEWLLRMRLMTMVLCLAVTVTLFRELFREDLAKIGHERTVRVVLWMAPPLLAMGATLPYATVLPFLWGATGVTTCLLVFVLAVILRRTRSRVAMWYSASLATMLAASMFEVVAAALGLQGGLLSAVNSVTAALASSLLASLAIAEQMRQEHDQRLDAQAQLQHTFEAMPIGLFTLDLQGRFTSANPALRSMLALAPDHAAWQQYFQEGAWRQLWEQLREQGHAALELRGRATPDGQAPRRYLVKAALANDKIEGSLQDVTESAQATEELRFMADNDALTKVLNRRGIERALEQALAEASADSPLAVAYLDLDRFKLINDLFGHNAGDEVLQQVCQRMGGMLSGSMALGRMGGDEFLILMPGTRMPLAAVICQGLVSAIGGTPYRVGDKAFHVRGSIGLIEVSTQPGTRAKDVISTADRACREAKGGHSDGLVIYEKNAQAFRDHRAEMQLVERLSGSRATEGLSLVMQPIMSLSSPHASLNFEVLLRMHDSRGRPIPTSRVIAAGENSGRMGVIDRWTLSAVLAWLNTHIGQLRNTRFVCMNLSGASLNDEKFMHDVYAMLAQNIHVASRLCFEITESVALHDLNNTRRFIDKVRSYGAKVALDDFGAGYTSFSYLKELPADLLKIDGSFIVNMNKHPANVAIVEAMVSLGRNLGMRTVAEWAEDAATVRSLVDIGVDYVQGFAVARPQAPARLLAATSSASFIEDPELARYVASLEQTDGLVPHVELFEHSRLRRLH
ncbi:EAL domain-containing protein [Pseudorhodoferax sp.]|uniref:EAL domain-containing protein n=1 Tax=Pseudorhodoferax sp. TaxID=1993553 RepID=UPI0039E62F89